MDGSFVVGVRASADSNGFAASTAAFHAVSNFDSGGPASYGLLVDDQTNATNNWAIKAGLGKVELGDALLLDPVAFSSIGTCNGGLEGTIRSVNDSTTNTLGATITGGGSNHVLAYCDGTNWTVMAK